MTATETKAAWTEANQAYVVAEFARLKQLLAGESYAAAETTLAAVRTAMNEPPAIDRLAEVFGLSTFERALLLLCAGVEMDSRLAAQCGEVQGRAPRACATFGLAVAALPEPHWSALTPYRPLRYFRLLEVEPGHPLTSAPLRIDERILHYLAGVNQLDPRLKLLVQASPFPVWIADEHKEIGMQAGRALVSDVHSERLLHFCGDDPQGQQDAAAFAAWNTGRQLYTARAEGLPAAGSDLEQFAVLWQRESVLLPAALMIQCGPSGFTAAARLLVERIPGPLMVGSAEPIRLERTFLRIDLNKPKPEEQRRLWERALDPASASVCQGTLDALSEQFRLSARAIFATGSLTAAERGSVRPDDLWDVCRSLSRPRLEDLAQRLDPVATWDDLVLPELQLQMLHQLASQVRHRMKVHETWGFAARGRRGLGVSALFAGDSGTGKTLAAEVLARVLSLDLYRIDLSAVVSKYIGETEKNLKQVFDAAEEGGVLLLFDEADALFGKRGDIKDSHDRYANIEVSYLLQRMEAYQGLAVLTTNLKSAMDKAFQRRLRFTVTFPFPDATQREAIWKRIFPAKTPTERLDARKLAQLNVTGGNIRNIALNAAFLAAETGQPVSMALLAQAAKIEAHKIERPLAEAEIRGWI
jgi:hypothetical protein